MRVIVALLCGCIFGLGLVVSGMTDTRKVQGFLDLFGKWDPTLIFVMGGAIIPMLIAWQISKRQTQPVLGGETPSEPSSQIDRPLVVGAVLFGSGWGLAGFCPGPALASLSFGGMSGLIFLGALICGMLIHKILKTNT